MIRPSKVTIIIFSLLLITLGIIISKFIFFLNTLDDDASLHRKNDTGNYKFIGSEFENVEWMMQVLEKLVGSCAKYAFYTKLIHILLFVSRYRICI